MLDLIYSPFSLHHDCDSQQQPPKCC